VTEAVTSEDGWTPAFDGQRPPFRDGNEAALTHGARSERRVGPLAAQIAAELLADPDTPTHLREPMFAMAVEAWARAEAICQLLRAFLDSKSIEDALTELTTETEDEDRDGGRTRRTSVARKVAAALDSSRRWEAHAANMRSKLGLDPATAAKVGRDLATSRYLEGATPLNSALDQIAAQRRKALTSGSAG
jgi:hypothetical protein